MAETKTSAVHAAGVIVDAGQRSRSALLLRCALLDEFTIYQIVGSVVDYLVFNGYVELGLDSGEGA